MFCPSCRGGNTPYEVPTSAAACKNPQNRISVIIEGGRGGGGDTEAHSTILEVRLPTDIEPAFQSAVQKGAGALLMLSSPLIPGRTKLLAGLALKSRLPAITLFTDFARDDGLMAYGPNLLALVRQGGIMAAKILLGANPAETPIETPAKFEFVLNLKTAKLLGLAIPATLLLRASGEAPRRRTSAGASKAGRG